MTCDHDRRFFFRRFFGEALSLLEEVRGHRRFRLSGLGDLPDGILANMRPVFNRDRFLRLEAGALVARTTAGIGEEYHPCSASQEHVLRRFDGETTLDEIAASLARTFGGEREQQYQQAKQLFIVLAGKGICFPADSPEGLHE